MVRAQERWRGCTPSRYAGLPARSEPCTSPECGRGRPRTVKVHRIVATEPCSGVEMVRAQERWRGCTPSRYAGLPARSEPCTSPECGRGRPRTVKVRRIVATEPCWGVEMVRAQERWRGCTPSRYAGLRARSEPCTSPECGRGRPRTVKVRRIVATEPCWGVEMVRAQERWRGCTPSRYAGLPARNEPCTSPECGRGRPRTVKVRRIVATEPCSGVEMVRAQERWRGCTPSRYAGLPARNEPCTSPECGRGRPRTVKVHRIVATEPCSGVEMVRAQER